MGGVGWEDKKGQGRERRDRQRDRMTRESESWVEVGGRAGPAPGDRVLTSLHTPWASPPSQKHPVSFHPPGPLSLGAEAPRLLGIPDSFKIPPCPQVTHAHAHTYTCTPAHTQPPGKRWDNEEERGVSLCPPAQPWELKSTQSASGSQRGR